MRYFDHDTTACADSRLLALRLQHGSVAIDLYWTLLERMYADEKPLNLIGSNIETKSVLHLVSINQEELENYVSTMLEIGLFEGTLENLFSARAMENIEAYRQKVETARQNGKKGGRKPSGKPSGFSGRNQHDNQNAKLRKEKKGDITSSVISPTSGGAAADKTAPPAAHSAKEIFDAVDEKYPDPTGYEPKDMSAYMEQHNAAFEQEHPDSFTPSPEQIAEMRSSIGKAVAQ